VTHATVKTKATLFSGVAICEACCS